MYDISGYILLTIVIVAGYLSYTRYKTNESKDSKCHEELYHTIRKRCEYLSSISPEAKEVYEDCFKRWINATTDRVSWRVISFLSFLFSIITTTLGYVIFSSTMPTSGPLTAISLSLFVNVVVLFLTLSSIRTWICYHVVTIH
jgi:hypothetical protein